MRSRYKKSLIIYSSILGALALIFLIYIFITLITYENHQINNYLINTINKLSDQELSNYLSEYNLASDLLEQYQEITSKKDLEVKKIADEEYEIYDGNRQIFTITTKVLKNKTKLGLFTYQEREVVDIIPNLSRGLFYYDVIIPSNYKLYLDGEEITDYSKSSNFIDLDFMYYNSSMPSLVTYEINNLDTSTQACIKELFRRYKFDLLMDVEHLYQILNEEYRKERFPNFEDLTQYIHENKSDLYLDSIEEYNVKNYDSYVQYTGKGQEDKYYIFDIQNLMTYTLFMDNYTIVTIEEEYNAVLPNPQAKYCINRVIQAINDKNYEFVYEKLNPVLRNNYYRNREDFEEFIHNHFYDKNDYEIEEEYLIISSDVYQYNVKIIDATGQEISYKRLTMTVTLKENTDFVISITSG